MKNLRKFTPFIFASILPFYSYCNTKTWSGSITGSPWNHSLMWEPNGIPGINDVAFFSTTPNINREEFTITIIAPLTVGGMEFQNANKETGYLIQGTTPLRLKSNGSISNIFIHPENLSPITIQTPLILGQDVKISNYSAQTMFLSGVITGSENGLLIEGAKEGIVEITGDENNSFSGSTTLLSGTVVFNKKSRFDAIGSNLKIASGLAVFKSHLQTPKTSILTLQATSGDTCIDLQNTSQAVDSIIFDSTIFKNEILLGANAILTLSGNNKNALQLAQGSSISGKGTIIVSGNSSGISLVDANAKAVIDSPIELSEKTQNITVNEASSTLSLLQGISKGSFIKFGEGTLEILSTQPSVSKITLSQGTLRTQASLITSPIENSATLELHQDLDESLNACISGNGTILKTGQKKLTVNSISSFTGNFEVLQGCLEGSSYSLSGPIQNQASVEFLQNENGVFPYQLSGHGTISKLGKGDLTLTHLNPLFGHLIIKEGNLIGTTDSIQGTVENFSTLTIDQDFDATFHSSIQGNGVLIKKGTGILSLDNNSSFIGEAIVESGSIKMLTNDSLGTSDLILKEDTKLILTNDISPVNPISFEGERISVEVDSGQASLNGALDGVSFIKIGQGTLDLEGESFVKAVLLEEGELKINGQTIAETITTAKDTLLSGSGTIEASLNIHGSLQTGENKSLDSTETDKQILDHFSFEKEFPEEPPTENKEIYLVSDFSSKTIDDGIHIVGDVNFSPDAQILIFIDPNKTSQLQIQGDVQLDHPTITIIPNLGSYELGKIYEFINADQINGELGAIILPYPMIKPSVNMLKVGDQQLFELSLDTKKFTDLFSKGNANQVAKYLDYLQDHPCQNSSIVLEGLYNIQSESALESALLKMQPSQFTSLSLAQSYDLLCMQNAIFDRLRNDQNRCKFSSIASNQSPVLQDTQSDSQQILFDTPTKDKKTSLWISFLGDYTKQSNEYSQYGYHAISPGAILSIDQKIGDYTAGAGLGYLYTDLDWKDHRGKAQIQNIYGLLYGQRAVDTWFITGQLVSGYSFYDTNRPIHFGPKNLIHTEARGNFSGGSGSLDLKAGYNIYLSNSCISPYIDIDYALMYTGSFQENNARSLNLSMKSHLADLLNTEGGFEWRVCHRKDFTLLKAYLQLSAIYEKRFFGKTQKGNFACGGSFDVQGFYPSRLLGSGGMGISANYKQATLTLGYQCKGRSGFIDQNLQLNFDWKF